jgi:hypothetical protein
MTGRQSSLQNPRTVSATSRYSARVLDVLVLEMGGLQRHQKLIETVADFMENWRRTATGRHYCSCENKHHNQ